MRRWSPGAEEFVTATLALPPCLCPGCHNKFTVEARARQKAGTILGGLADMGSLSRLTDAAEPPQDDEVPL